MVVREKGEVVSHEQLDRCLVNLVKTLKPQVALHDALDACKDRIAEYK